MPWPLISKTLVGALLVVELKVGGQPFGCLKPVFGVGGVKFEPPLKLGDALKSLGQRRL